MKNSFSKISAISESNWSVVICGSGAANLLQKTSFRFCDRLIQLLCIFNTQCLISADPRILMSPYLIRYKDSLRGMNVGTICHQATGLVQMSSSIIACQWWGNVMDITTGLL